MLILLEGRYYRNCSNIFCASIALNKVEVTLEGQISFLYQPIFVLKLSSFNVGFVAKKKLTFWLPTVYDSNQAAQLKRLGRMLKFCQKQDQMGLNARKPVFRGLRTTKAQTSLRIRAV